MAFANAISLGSFQFHVKNERMAEKNGERTLRHFLCLGFTLNLHTFS